MNPSNDAFSNSHDPDEKVSSPDHRKPANAKVNDDIDEFTHLAEEAEPGLLREFWEFLRYNKKWWLAPMIIVLLLFGLLIFLSGTPAMPFIYTLF